MGQRCGGFESYPCQTILRMIEMSKLILTICRGVPGSGKSFVAKALSAQTGGTICSTDDFFINKATGAYEFDTGRLHVNHLKCQTKARELMDAKTPHVIIDNTNISRSEMKPYIEAAEANGYNVQVVRVETDVETCIARNGHNVPADVIRRMATKLAAQPPVFEERANG